MNQLAERKKILAQHGAGEELFEELLVYNANAFVPLADGPPKFPMGSEAHVAHWRAYYEQADGNVFGAMSAGIPQLNFPIREGLSETSYYRDITRKGTLFHDCEHATGLGLAHPEKVSLTFVQSAAGEIPVLTIPHRGDFVRLVQAIRWRGEPAEIPNSMGACTVVGFNNWDRIHRYRMQWQDENPEGAFWSEGFPAFAKKKSNFVDCFILLSHGPYSNVPASELGLKEQEWLDYSDIIRREHEVTHYFTRRAFSSMRNNIIDEILADYMGIVAANGSFRADWMLAFLGLSNFPEYRQGRRLENYCRELSEPAFKVITSLVHAAVTNLEKFDQTHREALSKDGSTTQLLMALTRFTLEELAAGDAAARLFAYWQQPSPV